MATNHHFNPLNANELYKFSPGTYQIELMAKLVGRKRPICIANVNLEVPVGTFEDEISDNIAIYYNWSPLEEKYISSIEDRNEQLEANANNSVVPAPNPSLRFG